MTVLLNGEERAAASDPRRLIAARRSAAAPPPPPSVEEGALGRIRRTKQLRVAAVTDDAPYSSKGAADGQWQGLCVDMARDLAQALDVALEMIETPAADVVGSVTAGKVDLALRVTPSVQRALSVDLSRPVFYDNFALLSRKGFAPRRWTALDVPETGIAVANGTSADTVARHFAGSATITGFRAWDDALAAIRSGRSDCVVATVLRALIALHRDRDLGWLIVPAPVVRIPCCAAMRLEGGRVDGGGRLREIVDAWSEDNRSNGRVTGWIIAALGRLGIAPDAVPPTVNF